MTTDPSEIANKVFADVVANKRDITQTFYAGYGWDDPDERRARMASDQEVRRRNRERMAAKHGGIQRISDVVTPHLARAEALLNEGRVGAVDGTDALGRTDFMTYSQYACAVGWLTRQTRGGATVMIAQSSTTYIRPRDIGKNTDEEMAALEQEVDRGRNSESWPRTFRENEERLVALDKCEAAIVFIDGPIITQNLVSQSAGRSTLQRIFDAPKTFIGVIKDVSTSMAATKWAAYALEAGEMWVVGKVQNAIHDRNPADWVLRHIPSDFVRVAFRPNQKSFAIECREHDISMAMALIVADASPTVNHELPMLLETVDAQLRAGFNGAKVRNVLQNRLMAEGDYTRAVDIISERSFR
jgi:hypothetical protein